MRFVVHVLLFAALAACSDDVVGLDGALSMGELDVGNADALSPDSGDAADRGPPACDCIPWSEDFFPANTCFCFQEQWGCQDRPEIVSSCDINSDCWTVEPDPATGCMKPVVRFRGEQNFDTCNCRRVDGG